MMEEVLRAVNWDRIDLKHCEKNFYNASLAIRNMDPRMVEQGAVQVESSNCNW